MGWSQSSETWTAECNGRTFICSQLNSTSAGIVSNGQSATTVALNSSNVGCHERLADTASSAHSSSAAAATVARSAAQPTGPAPTGGAGFELGAEPGTERQACEAAGNTWGAPIKGRATCSGPAAELGFSADVAIKFCSGKACIITIHHRPESEWSGTFAELKGKLVQKYGPPQESEAVVPPGCRTETELVECVTNRGVRLHFSWSWPTGERVILSLGKSEPESDAAVRIDYTRPVRKVTANSSAL